MLTDVQTPFLGTPLVPLKPISRECKRGHWILSPKQLQIHILGASPWKTPVDGFLKARRGSARPRRALFHRGVVVVKIWLSGHTYNIKVVWSKYCNISRNEHIIIWQCYYLHLTMCIYIYIYIYDIIHIYIYIYIYSPRRGVLVVKRWPWGLE